MNILEYLKNNILVLDGATGSLLQKKGLPTGVRPEKWAVENPEVIIGIHRDYFDAGSNAVQTNTFGANLFNYDREELEYIIRKAIENVRIAAESSSGKQAKFVGFDIGPSGKLIKPYGDLDFEEAVSVFGYSAKLAEKYGADFIFIETMNDAYEAKAALLAARESTSLPVFVSNAYSEDGNLLTGASPEAVSATMEGLGADAIGVNCSFGPEALLPTVEKLLSVSSIPVIFKPNAGLPHDGNGCTYYDVEPGEFAEAVAKAVKSGARIVGGCCGTAPEYISALCKKIKGIMPVPVEKKALTVISSGRTSVVFGRKPVIIGERINPTGKKLIKEALREQNIDVLLGEAVDQQKAEADVLDVNCGLPEIDEKTVLCNAVSKLQATTFLPLQIDTSDTEAMKAALRIYNGKAMINSVNGKKESMASVFPLAKKYGGVIVALTLDENGIPATAEERFLIAEKIIKTAAGYGIEKKDLVFDPLAMSVSADANAARVTLDTVRLITERLKCNTILGVSNVSFGLPDRESINSAFFVSAMNCGLSSAIINPKSEVMMKSFRAFCALNGLDESFEEYISHSAGLKSVTASVAAAENDGISELRKAVQEGRSEKAGAETAKLLSERSGLEIINSEVIPALDFIGAEYEAKRAFLPQLLMSAGAAESAFEVVKKNADSASGKTRGKIVIATVRGDVHDIGKNIVKLLLENYGFDVIDLGKDVPVETVVKAVEEHKPIMLGLSALMTTTVPAMQQTIEAVRQSGFKCKIAVGGAVLTEEYSEKIGADKYCTDAMATVRYAEELTK